MPVQTRFLRPAAPRKDPPRWSEAVDHLRKQGGYLGKGLLFCHPCLPCYLTNQFPPEYSLYLGILNGLVLKRTDPGIDDFSETFPDEAVDQPLEAARPLAREHVHDGIRHLSVAHAPSRGSS